MVFIKTQLLHLLLASAEAGRQGAGGAGRRFWHAFAPFKQGSLVSQKGSGAGEGLRAFCLNIRRRGRSWDRGLCRNSWDGPAEDVAVVCSPGGAVRR